MLQSFQRFDFREHHGVNATGSGQPGHRKADLVRLGTQEQREESQVVGTGVVMSLSLPIGSMYAIYGNIYHQYTPVMLAYIPYMDPMGYGILIGPSNLGSSRIYPTSSMHGAAFLRGLSSSVIGGWLLPNIPWTRNHRPKPASQFCRISGTILQN